LAKIGTSRSTKGSNRRKSVHPEQRAVGPGRELLSGENQNSISAERVEIFGQMFGV
jgi:hypothetical protein